MLISSYILKYYRSTPLHSNWSGKKIYFVELESICVTGESHAAALTFMDNSIPAERLSL